MCTTIKIKRNIYDVVTEAACLSILAAVAVYLIISWGDIPEEIATHYNAAGVADSFGQKSEIIALPIIASAIYLLLTVVGLFPQIWNTGVKLTDDNRERVLRTTKNLLNTIKLLLVMVFTYLTLVSTLPLKFDIWFVTVFMTAMFGSIAYFIVKLIKAR